MKRRGVHIDSLVVHGGGISPSNGEGLARTVEAKLAQLLRAERSGPGEGRGADVVRVKARAVNDLSTGAIAKAVAHSVHLAMKGRT
jgi:hypothetical protein